MNLSPDQQSVLRNPASARLFLQGPAGAGKTTVGVEWMRGLLDAGVPAGEMLVLVPQRTLGAPYLEALLEQPAPRGARAQVATIAGLARRMIELFWPLVGGPAGFGRPEKPPVFLTLETAQYFMARMVHRHRPDAFTGVSIVRSRLYSQLIDNLNKAATIGIGAGDLSARLKQAFPGDVARHLVFDDAQACASAFRAYCLENNLLDFSLQLEVFYRHVWSQPLCRRYLREGRRYLIVDNVEEDSPATHDMLRAWLPRCASALLIYDHDAGYRRFLGSDPESAHALRDACTTRAELEEVFTAPVQLQRFGEGLAQRLTGAAGSAGAAGSVGAAGPAGAAGSVGAGVPAGAAGSVGAGGPAGAARSVGATGLAGAAGSAGAAAYAGIAGLAGAHLVIEHRRLFPDMLRWAAGEIGRLIHEEGVPATEIVVLAPYLSNGLRYALESALEDVGVRAYAHRPSRALRDEPALKTLLLFARLAHPGWGLPPKPYEVGAALSGAIADLDPVRAALLFGAVYRPPGAGTGEAASPASGVGLAPFGRVEPAIQQRVTLTLGQRYTKLHRWLRAYEKGPVLPFDHFLSRLFGEVLSQPGFAFHQDFAAAGVAANLIESVRKFRQVLDRLGDGAEEDLGRVYLEMMEDGVAAAQYMRDWKEPPADAVLLAPAYSFLVRNHAVAYQFWLDAGSSAWYERINQPLTHPYVLSRSWKRGEVWSEEMERAASHDVLRRLILGLVRRCRTTLYLGISELGENGFEQRGLFLNHLQRVLRQNRGVR